MTEASNSAGNAGHLAVVPEHRQALSIPEDGLGCEVASLSVDDKLLQFTIKP